MKGPDTSIILLGIELDTALIEVHLEKLHCLKQEIVRWQQCQSCTKSELLSLIGQSVNQGGPCELQLILPVADTTGMPSRGPVGIPVSLGPPHVRKLSM